MREDHPVSNIQWVPIEDIEANDYNPNSVAINEMRLLYLSIKEDGYTQPIVVIEDPDTGKFVIVDGFHRYTTARLNSDILESTEGCIPCVIIQKDINQRMAATVRHNRARGKHSIAGMGNMVFQMIENGMSDEDVCNKLGLEVDELLRLKHITGFSKLFENTEYKRAWTTDNAIKAKKEYESKDPI